MKTMYYSGIRLDLWPKQKGVRENDVLQWSYTRFMDPSRRLLVKMMYYCGVRLVLWTQAEGVSENYVLQWSYTRFMDPSRRVSVKMKDTTVESD